MINTKLFVIKKGDFYRWISKVIVLKKCVFVNYIVTLDSYYSYI